MTAAPKNGNGLSTKILMGVLGALWLAVMGSYLAQGGKIDALTERQSEIKAIATKALESTVRIEARLKTMDDAAVARATSEREDSATRIRDLENDSGRSAEPSGSTPRVVIPLPPAQRETR